MIFASYFIRWQRNKDEHLDIISKRLIIFICPIGPTILKKTSENKSLKIS